MASNIICQFSKLTNHFFNCLSFLDASQPDLIDNFIEEYERVLTELIDMDE